LRPAPVAVVVEPCYVVVISMTDPVAPLVAREWGTPPATADLVDGVPLRELGPGIFELRRPGPHVHDEGLDLRLPGALRARRPTLVFPSIHRSEQKIVCLTVHALGNLGARAELGGRPHTVTPADPRTMVQVLRGLSVGSAPEGLTATYEATHHGPELGVPGFFVEIGYGDLPEPPRPAVRLLSRVLRELAPDEDDRVALAIGGGHYAPHFTDLALRRRWAFGHIVSRHALEGLTAPTARAAYDGTDGAKGILFARAQDVGHPALEGLGPRLRDAEAAIRERPVREEGATRAARLSGT
jgi:D-tyrosyl-tRNA(Tyr) deacylase